MHGRWKTARVLLVEADEIYLPALQRYVAATCERRWGQNWYEEWAGRILELPKLDQFKRSQFEEKIEQVRIGREQPHLLLEHYDFARTVGNAVHARLFPTRWTGRGNEKRVKGAKHTMDTLSRHRSHWATFDNVVGRIIPDWIKVLERLPDVNPARDLRELEEEALTGFSSEQLQLMEQAAELGRARALAFPQLPNEPESSWFERIHKLDTMSMTGPAAQLSPEDHSEFEAEVERQLEHYMRMLPVMDDLEAIRRREECRTQLSRELTEAGKEGLTWRQLHAWRQHRVWREQYAADLEMWDDYVLQVLEAVDFGLTNEQLESWRIHQLNRELNGLNWEALESAVLDSRTADRLNLSLDHLSVWRRYRTRCELEDLDRPSLEGALHGYARPLPRSFTPELFDAWLSNQFVRQYFDLNSDEADFDRAIVEARSWRKSNLPADYLGVWWAHQSRSEAFGFARESLAKAEEIARATIRGGTDVLGFHLQLAEDLLRKTTGLPFTLHRAPMGQSGEQRSPAAAEIFEDYVRTNERLDKFVNSSLLTVQQMLEIEQPVSVQPPSTEALEEARRAGLTGAVRAGWFEDNMLRAHHGLGARDAEDAVRDWREARGRQVTWHELSLWWGVQTVCEAEGLDREPLDVFFQEVKEAHGYKITSSHIAAWFQVQSFRRAYQLKREKLDVWVRETHDVRLIPESAVSITLWGFVQACREVEGLQKENLIDWVRHTSSSVRRGVSTGEAIDWQVLRMEWEKWHESAFGPIDSAREIANAQALGMKPDEWKDWWTAQTEREAQGLHVGTLQEGAYEAKVARDWNLTEDELRAWRLRDSRFDLRRHDVRDGAREALEARRLGLTIDQLMTWWGIETMREYHGLGAVGLDESASSAREARELGMTEIEVCLWWLDQLLRETFGVKPAPIAECITQLRTADKLGMTGEWFWLWREAQALRESLRLRLEELDIAASDVEQAQRLNLRCAEVGAWWAGRAFRQAHQLSSLPLKSDSAEPSQARALGIADDQLDEWRQDQRVRWIEGMAFVELGTWWTARQSEAETSV